MRNSFKTKLIIPTTIILILSVTIMAIMPSLKFSNYNDMVTKEDLDFYAKIIKEELSIYLNKTYVASEVVSKDKKLLAAIEAGNTEEIKNILLPTLAFFGITYYTVADANGDVILRTHDPLTGDSVLKQQNIKDALNGKISSFFEAGTQVKVSGRTGAPIYNDRGEIIAAISAGYQFDTDEFVDSLKEKYNIEATVFSGDTRVATTLMQDGQRIVGTQLVSNIAKIVLEDGQEYRGDAPILGKPFKTVYIPILDASNKVFAIMFVGISTAVATAEAVSFARDNIIIGASALIVSLLILIIMANSITKPLTKLTGELKNLARGKLIGNLSIRSKDEVGALASSVIEVSNSVRSLNDEINVKIRNYREGRMSIPIPVDEFEGCYKEIGENINVITTVMGDDMFDILNCIEGFSNGNFKANIKEMPGERAAANEMINTMRNNLINVRDEIRMLSKSAINGALSTRADSNKYSGDWREIIEELNLLLKEVSVPFDKISKALSEMALGHMNAQISGDLKGDYELIKNSFNNTLEAVSSYITEINSVLTEMANDNYQVYISRKYIGSFDEIKKSVNMIIDKFNMVLSEISSSTKQITVGSVQISDSSMILAKGATDQASAVSVLEQAMTDVSNKISNIAENSSKAESLTSLATESTIIGKNKMHLMVEAMNKIAEVSNDIGSTMRVIDDIALQTNLLALNAAVEAARAGEHGKSFSVVAEEVRNLASKSQNSAKKIADLIELTNERISDGVKIASETSFELDEIVDRISNVTDIVVEIAKDTSLQAESITQNNKNIEMISRVTMSNSAASEETATTAEELASQAESFEQTIKRFKLRS